MLFVILDDHPAILKVLEATIKKVVPAVQVRTFTELKPTLKYIRTMRPDYVFTDIQIYQEKQTDIAEICAKYEIPFGVYTSHVNASIIKECDYNGCKVFVGKTAHLDDLEKGMKALVNGKEFRCSVSKAVMSRSPEERGELPKVYYTQGELPVIMAQITGESTVDLAKRTGKSVNTVRNQRISLMHKNDCSMEEVARRYLYWHTEG